MKKSPVRARAASKVAVDSAAPKVVTAKAATATPRATQKTKLKSSPQAKAASRAAANSEPGQKVAAKGTPGNQLVAPAAAKTTVKKVAAPRAARVLGATKDATAKTPVAKPKASSINGAAKERKTSGTRTLDTKSKNATTKKVDATEGVPKAKATKVKGTKAKTTKAKAKAPTAKVPARNAEKDDVTGAAKAAGQTTGLRATKKRAPKDLALQYGEKIKAPRATAAKATPRKRRDAAMRARLQQVIAPDDGLLLRLARAGVISSSLAPAGEEKPLRAVKPRRSRKWETRCGKCGVSAQYMTSAALCVKCGAILVRD